MDVSEVDGLAEASALTGKTRIRSSRRDQLSRNCGRSPSATI